MSVLKSKLFNTNVSSEISVRTTLEKRLARIWLSAVRAPASAPELASRLATPAPLVGLEVIEVAAAPRRLFQGCRHRRRLRWVDLHGLTWSGKTWSQTFLREARGSNVCNEFEVQRSKPDRGYIELNLELIKKSHLKNLSVALTFYGPFQTIGTSWAKFCTRTQNHPRAKIHKNLP